MLKNELAADIRNMDPAGLETLKYYIILIAAAVANFMGNSIIHTKPDGNVIVRIYDEDDKTVFSVTDNGGGIPPEDAKKLFNRFSQGTSKKRSTGTGLGLYLSRQIIEAHEGEIGLETELDKGSTFYFELKKIIKGV